MYVLGIHDGHNASAVLLKDGHIIAGVQEERLRGVKNALGLPYAAIADVLNQGGVKPNEVDWVAIAGLHSGEYISLDQTIHPSDQILKWHQAAYNQPRIELKQWVKKIIPAKIYEALKGDKIRDARRDLIASLGFRRDRIQFVEHHSAHAASAYFGWGKLNEPILILTNDGMGDDVCATVNIGKDGQFERIASVPYSESVAEVYALTTYLLGMVPLEHEYKIMGMAPYSNPSRAEKVYAQLAELIDFADKGGIVWNRKNGIPPLSSAYHYLEKIYRLNRFDSICGGVQKFTEEFLKQWVRNAIQETGIRKIALSGGIFMNVKANKLLLELEEVEDLFVFPSCGDETNAIGAAYWLSANEMRKIGRVKEIPPISGLYWGKQFNDYEIENAISEYSFGHKVNVETPSDIEKKVAEIIANGQVVARSSGRMEFGARALGNRSILANPANSNVIKIINEMIKKRDFWMPFAPSVTVERVGEYLQKPKNVPSHYMTLTFDSNPAKASAFAAGIHPYDGTARPQEVTQLQNPEYHRLIQEFGEKTGEEIILNTSFNLHGFPNVYSPNQALNTFDNSGLGCLALGNFLLTKK